MRALLRQRDARIFLVGLLASKIGDSLLLLVLSIWTKELTGSNAAAGVPFLCIVVAYVVGPVLVWPVDRFRRRPFLIYANLASAFMLIPLLGVGDASDVWLIYGVAAAYGLSFVAINAAVSGLLQQILPPELLADANGAIQTVKQGLRVGGPLVGVGLYATLGGATVALINAGSFLVAATAVAAVNTRELKPAQRRRRLGAEVTAGIRHIRAERVLLKVTTAGALTMFSLGVFEVIIFALVDDGLHRPAEFVGVLAAAQGVGALVTGFVAAQLVHRRGEVATTAIGVGGLGVGFGITGITVMPFAICGCILAGAGLPLTFVGIMTLVQKRTPQHLIGRTTAAVDSLLSTPQAISILAAVVLVDVVNYRVMIGIAGVTMTAAAVGLWSSRAVTHPTFGSWSCPNDADRGWANPKVHGHDVASRRGP